MDIVIDRKNMYKSVPAVANVASPPQKWAVGPGDFPSELFN